MPDDTSRTDPASIYDYRQLATWRMAAGLRRERVAADLDLSLAWLRDLENGVGVPSLQLLAALAAYYGHEMAELFPLERSA